MKRTEEYLDDLECYVHSFADLERVHRVVTTKRWADMTAEEQDFLENEARQWIHILRTDVNIEERVA